MAQLHTVTFEELESTDVISIDLVPERKGLIIKHCEYYVSSRRHGTTVTRRYNEFVQLYDILIAKYPYRAVCSLPPKHVVVGGGSAMFLQRRRAALQRWLTLVAQHPVLAHDADLRAFLCEPTPKLDKPKYDEFIMAGTCDNIVGLSMDELESTFVSDQEQLRLIQLGLGRLAQVFERAEQRCESEIADIRELGAGLAALGSAATNSARWMKVQRGLAAAAQIATSTQPFEREEESTRRAIALDALTSLRAMRMRLPLIGSPRRKYALHAAAQESEMVRAYALAALEESETALKARAESLQRLSGVWAALHSAAMPQTV